MSARAELSFSVARRLGLDPVSLLGADEPRFLWREEARFKHLANEDELELAGITSFGRAVASALVAAAPPAQAAVTDMSARQLRELVLGSGRPYVDLLDLLNSSWAFGAPVVHLRVFPWPQKRMAAMTVAVNESPAILLAKDAVHPPSVAFYLAHELGHLALGHVQADRSIVDLESDGTDTPLPPGDDDEEVAADKYALELLSGSPEPAVELAGARPNATRLADAALERAQELQIEPGTIAMLFGYSTRDWTVANGALKIIYSEEKPVWREVNRVARRELQLDRLPDDSADFVAAVIGDPEE